MKTQLKMKMVKLCGMFFLLTTLHLWSVAQDQPTTALEIELQNKLNELYYFADTPQLEIAREYINEAKKEEFISDVLKNWKEIAPLLYTLELTEIHISNYNEIKKQKNNKKIIIDISNNCENSWVSECQSIENFINTLKLFTYLSSLKKDWTLGIGYSNNLESSKLKFPMNIYFNAISTLISIVEVEEFLLLGEDKITQFNIDEPFGGFMIIDIYYESKALNAIIHGEKNRNKLIQNYFTIEKAFKDPTSSFYVDENKTKEIEIKEERKRNLNGLHFHGRDIQVYLRWLDQNKTSFDIKIEGRDISENIKVENGDAEFPIKITSNGFNGTDGNLRSYYNFYASGTDGSDAGNINVYYEEGLLEKFTFTAQGGYGGKAGSYREGGLFNRYYVPGNSGRDGRDGNIQFFKK